MNTDKNPAVPVELDRRRNLCMDFNALAEIQALKLGLDQEALDGLLVNAPMKTVRDLMWAGLVGEDESLTRADVGRMLASYGVAKAIADINRAFGLANPKPEAGESPLATTAPSQAP